MAVAQASTKMQYLKLKESVMTPRSRARLLVAIALTLGASLAYSEKSATSSQFDKERAVCMTGRSNQDQATCLKEAGAARDAARRGQLTDADAASYKKNALDRCKALAGADARDCVTRINGGGTASGSVEAGGLYRESVTTQVPAAASVEATATPATPASAPE